MNQPIQPLRAAIARAFALSLSVGALAACGGGSGGGGSDNTPPDDTNSPPDDSTPPDDSSQTFTDRVYALGAQFDQATGDFVIYTAGLREDGTPVTSGDFAGANVSVDGTPVEPLDVSPVTDADGQLASISFLTDYSHSMPQSGLESVSEIYGRIVDAMPPVFNASAFVFTTPLSDTTPGHPRPEYVKYTFDENVGDATNLKSAFGFDESIERKATPLNDAVTWALFGAGAIDGLNDQCRPIRMLFAFADGEENGSVIWQGDPPTYGGGESLYERLDRHNVSRFMLGVAWSGDAETEPAALESTLSAYAGETGAHVLAYNDDQGVRTQATNLADALSEMTKLTVQAGAGQTVQIEMDGTAISVDVDKFTNELQACEAD